MRRVWGFGVLMVFRLSNMGPCCSWLGARLCLPLRLGPRDRLQGLIMAIALHSTAVLSFDRLNSKPALVCLQAFWIRAQIFNFWVQGSKVPGLAKMGDH